MFERYTEKARRVIFFARYEASQYGSQVIDTEHLLLGLLREEKKVCFSWLPTAKLSEIQKQIESLIPRQPPISTAVDLPLSKAGKRALDHAKSEADRVNSKWIGTEHLLLGLIQEESPVSKLLHELGADTDKLRALFDTAIQQTPPESPSPASIPFPGVEIIQIHGSALPAVSVRARMKQLHAEKWHWHKTFWKPRDMAVNRKSGKFSFDLSLAGDSENFEILKNGWKNDYCEICSWELFESEDDHGSGYTNGRIWVCLECYEKFWDRPDFISGSYSDLT